MRPMPYLRRIVQFFIVLSLGLLSCLSSEDHKTPETTEEHETQHELALRLERCGLPNFYRVTKRSKKTLYVDADMTVICEENTEDYFFGRPLPFPALHAISTVKSSQMIFEI